RGRAEAARTELREASALSALFAPLSARAALGLGQLALEAKNLAEAEAQLTLAQARVPEGYGPLAASVHLALHQLRRAQGHFDAAASEGEQAAREFCAARHRLGEAHALASLAALYRERTLPGEAQHYLRAAALRYRAAGQPHL